jgi:3D (Asp-Asp-Asp) domain-containing protein
LISAICAKGEVVYVNAPNGLNIRQSPGIESKSIQVLDFGQKVVVVDDEPGLNGWLRVEGDGYIDGTWTQTTDPFEEMELLGEWRITAYAETGYPCANGNYPTLGYTVACNSLPFGTEVYIDGVGFRTVEDTDGGAMGNEWIDLYLGDYTTCVQWGDQTKRVWKISSDRKE